MTMTVPSTYRRQFSHERQRPNSTLNLFNLYNRSVFRVLAGFVSPVHLSFSFSPKSFFEERKSFPICDSRRGLNSADQSTRDVFNDVT
jgi:hypothetical protein